MLEPHHLPPNEESESIRDILTRAFALLDRKGPKKAPAKPSPCLSEARLEALARRSPALPVETHHLHNCRACHISLVAIQDELASDAEADADMRAAATRASVMAMREGGIAPETTVTTFLSAIRNGIREGRGMGWSLEGAWGLLDFVKKLADDTAEMDAVSRRRLAAEYGDVVTIAPETIKVTLVYGLIRLKGTRRFAMNVVREIAMRPDPLAHRVLVSVLLTETPELMAVDSERWAAISADAMPALEPYRRRVAGAVARLFSSVRPPHTLADARTVLRRDAIGLAAKMFSSRAPHAVVLQLLAIREYLRTVATYGRETYSDLLDSFPSLTEDLYESARNHHAPLLLAMEAAETLRPSCPVETLIQKLIACKPVPARHAAEDFTGKEAQL